MATGRGLYVRRKALKEDKKEQILMPFQKIELLLQDKSNYEA